MKLQPESIHQAILLIRKYCQLILLMAHLSFNIFSHSKYEFFYQLRMKLLTGHLERKMHCLQNYYDSKFLMISSIQRSI